MKDIAFHITDIVENGIGAGASEIKIGLNFEGPGFSLTVEDNGRGMSEETVRKATNPFYTTRTTRKVGLGLPFLIQNAEQSGGGVEIDSEPGRGTKVTATFMLDNIDCPPMGDLAGTFMLIITGNPDINIILTITCVGEQSGTSTDEEMSGASNEDGLFEISTEEIKQIMDGVPIGHPEVATLVREIIQSNLDLIIDSYKLT